MASVLLYVQISASACDMMLAYACICYNMLASPQVERLHSVDHAKAKLEFKTVNAGSLVLLEGIDDTIDKTATVVPDLWDQEDVHIFKPLQFTTAAVVKIATEPLNPSELPKMVDGLRKISKSYPLVCNKVEESGEHTILGTGELYLDSVMKDLRELYAGVLVQPRLLNIQYVDVLHT